MFIIKTYRPNRHTLTIWRILLSIAAIIPAVAIAFVLSGNIYRIAFIVWFFVYLFFFIVFLPLYYNGLSYIVNEYGVTLKKGILWRKSQTIPFDKIQFSALSANPFSRFFSITSLRLVCPGAQIMLSGLTIPEAKEIAGTIEKETGDL